MPYQQIEVSEKTLEMNINAEILAWIRRLRGCEQAFIVGMKQSQEARNGIDSLLSNVPKGRHLLLQYKAPHALPAGGNPYKFSLSARQYANLARMASLKPRAVFYVLPHLNQVADLRASSPDFLSATWFLSVNDLLTQHVATNSGHSVSSMPPTCSQRGACPAIAHAVA